MGKDIGLANTPKIDAVKPLLEQGFILVTDDNRKNVIKTGRILYTFETIKNKNVLVNFFHISPRFTKGWWNVANFPWDLSHPYVNGKTHYKVYWDVDQDYNSWKNTYKYMIDKSINKNLYFNINDPILRDYESS